MIEEYKLFAEKRYAINGYNFFFKISLYKIEKRFLRSDKLIFIKSKEYATDEAIFEYLLKDFREIRFRNFTINYREGK